MEFTDPGYIGCGLELTTKEKKKKYKKQLKKKGFDDTVTWSLDYSIMTFILPRLKRYKKVASKVIDFSYHEGFEEAINEMIEGFEIALTGEFYKNDENNIKIQKAWDNLAKWHNQLWW